MNDDEISEDYNKIKTLNAVSRKEYPLIVENLVKVYFTSDNREKLALNNFSLLLRSNEIFGLLGPNGAGKTTFFSVLTGMYEPSSGNAWVGGNSILSNISKIQEMIGYCPQFDLLWNDLTVEEHLYFYSRLKNVKLENAKINVEKTLKDIKLDNYRDFLVKELSGGMKRRLSLGISIVGSPKIVFLDEPTTGLDPENKRQIWEILSNCKENKCMILTTHLMDEAEVLSDRIGIITNGSLKCLGTQYKLKRVYGKGFKLVINLNNLSGNDLLDSRSLVERNDKVIEFISKLFNGSTLKQNFKSSLIFEVNLLLLIHIKIPNNEFDAEILFQEIEYNKESLFIKNWAISQVTLEDIFISLTETEISLNA